MEYIILFGVNNFKKKKKLLEMKDVFLVVLK